MNEDRYWQYEENLLTRQALSEAYEILSDLDNRGHFDRLRDVGDEQDLIDRIDAFLASNFLLL